jgi:STAS domain
VRWFVLDAIPVSQIDVTGWHVLTELMVELKEQRIRFVIAGWRTQIRGCSGNGDFPLDRIERHLLPNHRHGCPTISIGGPDP